MHYLSTFSPEASNEIRATIVQAIASRYPFGNTKELATLSLAGDLKSIIDYTVDYNTIQPIDAIYARQIIALYSKDESLDIGIDKEKVAYGKFLETEEKCHQMNWGSGRQRLEHCSGRVASIIATATWKIADVLGPVPKASELSFAFGPGATTSTKMAEACPRTKLSAKLECSSNLVSYLPVLLSEAWPLAATNTDQGVASVEWEDGSITNIDWSDEQSEAEAEAMFYTPPATAPNYTFKVSVDVVPGKLTFVPKNAKTYRSIVIEPSLNGFAQKGVGTYLKSRLRLCGVDLSDQTRNRSLAKEGSMWNNIATIDLSSASDMISLRTVEHLLPLDWFDFLTNLRTPTVKYHGRELRLEKFSTMGNGFTFELESLIFWALAMSVTTLLGEDTKKVSVYGDDIIVPVACYDALVEVLEVCGFSVNLEKSYAKGPFRESCGGDYLDGLDIRPFYIRRKLDVRTLFSFHNYLYRHFEFELASVVKSLIPSHVILMGPDGFGDGHLLGDHTLRQNRKLGRDGWEGGYFDTYTLKPKRLSARTLPGDWIVPLYSVYTRSGKDSPTDPNVVRGSKGYAKISIYTLTTGLFR